MTNIVDLVRLLLSEKADEKTKVSGERFFKESVRLYGVRAVDVRKIASSTLKQIARLSKHEIFDLCEQLWQSQIMEEAMIACHWSYALRKQYAPEDFTTFECWVNRYVSNWATCDTLCNHTIGTFLERFPEFVETMKTWCLSENRWVRRASAVSFILPAKKGLFKENLFDIADRLLLDGDDLVQKGYGWMLKELAEAYEEEVYQFILERRAVMPRTALRYAIEKMPAEKKREAMKKV